MRPSTRILSTVSLVMGLAIAATGAGYAQGVTNGASPLGGTPPNTSPAAPAATSADGVATRGAAAPTPRPAARRPVRRARTPARTPAPAATAQ